MSELQLHRAAIAPQLMLAELGRVFFDLILCLVIIVFAFAKCFPKPNEPNDPDDDWNPQYSIVAQRDKTDKETQTKKRDKSRDKAKPGGRLPAYCGAPAAASRLTAGLPAGPGFSRFPFAKL